jgi:hypothetical protein
MTIAPAATSDLVERARRFADDVLIPLEEQAELAGGRLPPDVVAEIKRSANPAPLHGRSQRSDEGVQACTML